MQQKLKRQQFIYQLKEGESLHKYWKKIFLLDQSVESFKLMQKDITPQYKGQKVKSCLKQMNSSFKDQLQINLNLKQKAAKKITTDFSTGQILGDRFYQWARFEASYSDQKKHQVLMDFIYVHQMVQSIGYLQGIDDITTNDLFVVKNESLELVDYCCLQSQQFAIKQRVNDKLWKSFEDNEKIQFKLRQLELKAYKFIQYMRKLDKMGIQLGAIHNSYLEYYSRGYIILNSSSFFVTCGGAKEFYRQEFTDYFSVKYELKTKTIFLDELKELVIRQLKNTFEFQYYDIIDIGTQHIDYMESQTESATLEYILNQCKIYKSDIQAISANVLTNSAIVLECILQLRLQQNFPIYTGTLWRFFANCLDHSFACLQIPHAKIIEKLPHYDRIAEQYVTINYYYIMDEIAGIAMETFGEKDITQTRKKLHQYLIYHNKPSLWYSIILKLLDDIHILVEDYKQGNYKLEKKIQYVQAYYTSLKQYDLITDPSVKETECKAIVDCIMHLFQNFQVAIIGFHANRHPAQSIFESISVATFDILVKDFKYREELRSNLYDQIFYFRDNETYY